MGWMVTATLVGNDRAKKIVYNIVVYNYNYEFLLI